MIRYKCVALWRFKTTPKYFLLNSKKIFSIRAIFSLLFLAATAATAPQPRAATTYENTVPPQNRIESPQ